MFNRAMGTGEESSPPMSSKLAASTQETPTTSSYPDWSASMQAYYGAGATPPPYFTSPVPSPAPHPYMWGSQHVVTPYGSPLPYPALYPHGGIYAHPNMTLAQSVALTNTETEGKASNGKELMSFDKGKGTSKNTGLAGGKSGEGGKATSGSGNDDASQSSESVSESSSEATDENSDQRASSASKKRSFNQMRVDGGNLKISNDARYDGENPPALAPGKTSVPTTNVNIGMDLWNASPAGPAPIETRTNASGASPQGAPAMVVGHEGISHNHQWIQDERELKREKRKQSNRESARRSRLRKQAECEELQTKVQKLGNDNRTLRDELNVLAEECEKLTSENNSIMEELTRSYGRDVVSNLEGSYQNEALQSLNGEQSSQGHDTSVENNSNSMMCGQNRRLFNTNASNANHDS